MSRTSRRRRGSCSTSGAKSFTSARRKSPDATIVDPRAETLRALKRLLANWPLTAVPKRPSDQQLVVTLAAAQFEPPTPYNEGELHETLKGWILTVF